MIFSIHQDLLQVRQVFFCADWFLKYLNMEGAGTAKAIPGSSGAGTYSFTADQFQQLMATIATAGNVEEVLDEKLGKLKEIYRVQEVQQAAEDCKAMLHQTAK